MEMEIRDEIRLLKRTSRTESSRYYTYLVVGGKYDVFNDFFSFPFLVGVQSFIALILIFRCPCFQIILFIDIFFNVCSFKANNIW